MNAPRLARFGTLAAALVLFALPGCIKAKMKVALGKDGSGTITETDTLDMSKLGELAEMMKGMGGGQPGEGQPAEGGDPFKELDEESNPDAIKKKLAGKKGVELLSATRTEDPEKKTRTSERKIKFTTLEDYFRAGMSKSVDVKLEAVAGGAWKLTQNMTMPGGEGGAGQGPEAEQMMAMMKPMLEPFLGEMEMNFSIDLPGTVVETNGTKNEAGTGVTWKMGFADLFDAAKRSFTVTFKGEGLTLKPFHVVLDEKGEVKDPNAKPAGDAPKDPAAPKEEAPKEPAVPDAPK